MPSDLERRRDAIVRALRGSRTESVRGRASRRELGELAGAVDDLSRRVDAIADELTRLRQPGAEVVIPVHEPEDPAADEPITRASVPPLRPSVLRDHAFDVLLGTAVAQPRDQRADEDAASADADCVGDRC